MNLKLNAMHLHILELLKQLGIRCLIDDQYQDLRQDYMQLWLPQPLTETEVKQLEKFHKKHYAIWSNTEHPWGNVKRDLELEHMDAGSYSKTKATLVMIRMTERLEFEQAWQQRIGAVCNDTNLDFVASRCDQPAVIDAQSQAIANSFSDDWLKPLPLWNCLTADIWFITKSCVAAKWYWVTAACYTCGLTRMATTRNRRVKPLVIAPVTRVASLTINVVHLPFNKVNLCVKPSLTDGTLLRFISVASGLILMA